MPDSHAHITIGLQGRTSGDASPGNARLSDFSNVCNSLRSCLKHVARCVAGTEDIDYEISVLRTGSAVIGIDPILNGISADQRDDVSQTFRRTISTLEEGGELDSRLDFSAIRCFQGFCAPLNHGASLTVGDTTMTHKYVEHVSALLEPESPALGSVSGMLESVSIHRGNKFVLYPPMPGEGVDCVFNPSVLQDVLLAVGHNVTVYGTLYYAKTKVFPSRVEVDSFETEPHAEDLPTLLDACGILNNGADSTGSTRRIRDEWK